MSHHPNLAPAAAGLLLVALAAAPAWPATFQGRSLDGRRYQGSILNSDYGLIDGVEIKFHDEHAFVYLHGGGRIVLILEDEEITDPHRIPASDPLRGIVWEISVKDLGGR